VNEKQQRALAGYAPWPSPRYHLAQTHLRMADFRAYISFIKIQLMKTYDKPVYPITNNVIDILTSKFVFVTK